ncbi:unnamed protein product, partial [Urochloa humidicola]
PPLSLAISSSGVPRRLLTLLPIYVCCGASGSSPHQPPVGGGHGRKAPIDRGEGASGDNVARELPAEAMVGEGGPGGCSIMYVVSWLNDCFTRVSSTPIKGELDRGHGG